MLPARVISDHSVLKTFINLRNCYSTIRRNYQNKMLCCQKDMVIFVRGAFSLDISIIYQSIIVQNCKIFALERYTAGFLYTDRQNSA